MIPKSAPAGTAQAPRVLSVHDREIQQLFSCFGEVFGTRTWAVMSLRNADIVKAERVLLLGGSDPRLFPTRPGSKAARYAVMSVNSRPFNTYLFLHTYLFWGSRSRRPKTEASVLTVCSLPPPRSLPPAPSLGPAGSAPNSPPLLL